MTQPMDTAVSCQSWCGYIAFVLCTVIVSAQQPSERHTFPVLWLRHSSTKLQLITMSLSCLKYLNVKSRLSVQFASSCSLNFHQFICCKNDKNIVPVFSTSVLLWTILTTTAWIMCISFLFGLHMHVLSCFKLYLSALCFVECENGVSSCISTIWWIHMILKEPVWQWGHCLIFVALFTVRCYTELGIVMACRLPVCLSVTYRDRIGWHALNISDTIWYESLTWTVNNNRRVIGADSTGANGACAPVHIKEPGQRSPFAPVTFRESTIYRLDCALTGVFGAVTAQKHLLRHMPRWSRPAVRHSVRASICPSRNASRRHPCRLLGVQYIYSLPSAERRR